MALIDNKEVMTYWDYEKNILDPNNIKENSYKKAWFICNKNHTYDIEIAKQVLSPNSCPICNNKRTLKGYNDLFTTHAHLKNEWDWDKNIINPYEIRFGTDKQAYWICENNHSYKSQISNRTRMGAGCAYCANQKVLQGYNDLESQYPEIAKLWAYDKNSLNPNQVIAKSNKKAWWKCEFEHSYNQNISSKTISNIGCPICSGKQTLSGYNDFATLHSELLKEWDFNKNTVKPSEIAPASNKKVWWLCKENHSFYALVSNRTILGRNCPICSGQKVLQGYNDVATTFPKILDNWDWNKNSITPYEYTVKSKKDAWFLCDKGHSYSTKIRYFTTAEIPCFYCNNLKVLRGYNDLATTHPEIAQYWDNEKNTISIYEVHKHYRSKVWWNCDENHSYDVEVIVKVANNTGCPICSNRRIITGLNDLATLSPDIAKELDARSSGFSASEIANKSGKRAWWLCANGHSYEMIIYDRVVNNVGCPYCNKREVLSGYNDIFSSNKDLIDQWCYELNINIDPTNILYNTSTIKYWWKCKNNHNWQRALSDIINRSRNNCPYCTNKKVLIGYNDLETLRPDLINEFNNNKNIVSMNKYSVTSNKKVWWTCKFGHDWEAVIGSRTLQNTGCPVCSNLQVLKGYNDLQTLEPLIAAELDSVKTGFFADAITAYSGKRAYWICAKCAYEWDAIIYSRTKMLTGCPRCVIGCISRKEVRLVEEIRLLSPDTKIITNSRKIIPPYELDVYLPNLDIAIEFNGTYWHSDKVVQQNKGMSADAYHQMKTDMCNSKNIDLIHVKEEDWDVDYLNIINLIMEKMEKRKNFIFNSWCII